MATVRDSDRASRTAARIQAHVEALCAAGADRHVGGAGNHAANRLFAVEADRCGLAVQRLEFPCVEWDPGDVVLTAGGETFDARAGPYSPPCDVAAVLRAAGSIDELAALGGPVGMLLLHGAIAAEQLTPKRYPFYQVPEHAAIIAEIERLAPAAVVAATGRNPGYAGSVYPFPLVSDADFDIPSVCMKDVDGARLLARVGETAVLRSTSRRVPARAEQVIARWAGRVDRRILVMAHIDTVKGTPGALDNAAGVACLLALAERIGAARLAHTVELLPFNGEDHYAAPGETAYIAACDDRFDDVTLAVNIDAAGYRDGPTAVSHYGCPADVVEAFANAVGRRDRIVEGAFWPQSDHMVFAMRGVPAVAVTSEAMEYLGAEITHSTRDTPDLVDPGLLAETVDFVADLVAAVDALRR